MTQKNIGNLRSSTGGWQWGQGIGGRVIVDETGTVVVRADRNRNIIVNRPADEAKILAAPELLQALQGMIEAIDIIAAHAPDTNMPCRQHSVVTLNVLAANNAIAKAVGATEESMLMTDEYITDIATSIRNAISLIGECVESPDCCVPPRTSRYWCDNCKAKAILQELISDGRIENMPGFSMKTPPNDGKWTACDDVKFTKDD